MAELSPHTASGTRGRRAADVRRAETGPTHRAAQRGSCGDAWRIRSARSDGLAPPSEPGSPARAAVSRADRRGPRGARPPPCPRARPDIGRGQPRCSPDVHDDPLGPAGSEGHQNPHTESGPAEVGVRHKAIRQVVDRHDPTEAFPRGRCIRETVDEIDLGPSSQAREQLLLAPDPIEAIARRDGTVTAGISSPQGPPVEAASRLTNAMKRLSGRQRRAQGSALARRFRYLPSRLAPNRAGRDRRARARSVSSARDNLRGDDPRRRRKQTPDDRHRRPRRD